MKLRCSGACFAAAPALQELNWELFPLTNPFGVDEGMEDRHWVSTLLVSRRQIFFIYKSVLFDYKISSHTIEMKMMAREVILSK